EVSGTSAGLLAAPFAAPPTTDVAVIPTTSAISTVANAHARKPCAESRKYSWSLCTPTQRVRSRPARKPPSAEAMIEIRQRLIPATTEIVVPDGGELAQGFAAE